MKDGGFPNQTVSFTIVLFILLIVLFPLLTGMRKSLGVQGTWSQEIARWHDDLASSVAGEETVRNMKKPQGPAEPLRESLEREEFRALMRYSPPLASSIEELVSLIRHEDRPGSLEELLEIEMHIDRVTEELEKLSVAQASSFEILLFSNFFLTAILLFFFGYQGRQLLTAREEKLRAEEMKHRAVAIHEAERKKLARDLHDGLSQNIALARMSLDRLPEGNEKGKLRLSLDQSLQELRNILYNLRSMEDFSLSLSNLVRRECTMFREKYGLTVSVDIQQGVHPHWDEEQLTHFIRILQEGLVNVIRHSGAGKVVVSLHRNDSYLELLIRDDGRGVELFRPGLGITGMQERTVLLEGTINWRSSAGEGTEINLTVPEVLS
ncbi:MAG: sensor histidine kinase [Spirochaetales bacterium]|nr:sensor histidine kinase [Spirochaetales bacterium]